MIANCTKHKHSSEASALRCALKEAERKKKRRKKLEQGVIPMDKKK